MLLHSKCVKYLLATALVVASGFAFSKPPSLQELVKFPLYDSVLLSPDGEKIAVTVIEEGKTVLAFMSLDPLEITYVLRFKQEEQVGDVEWVNDDRVVVGVVNSLGWFDTPFYTGKLFAIDYNGRNGRTIFGYDSKEEQYAHATVISTLENEKKKILISTHPWTNQGRWYRYTGERIGEVLKLDVHSGRTVKVMTHPGRGGRAFANASGDVLFAGAYRDDDEFVLFQRREDEWVELECEAHCLQRPMGYSEDGSKAYLASNRGADTIGIELFDLASGEREILLRDERVDVDSIDWYPGSEELMYAILEDGKPSYRFLDETRPYNRFFRGLLKAFDGRRVELHSSTPDGTVAVVRVSSDDIASDFYLANRETKQVSFLLSSAAWLRPESLARTEVINLKARDGTLLQGYFTRPTDTKAPYPTVVVPHGGPSARDFWDYNRELQILASQGYGVLQVNFRGSTGYGRNFRLASDLVWGSTVQDDITDTVRWAIAEGLAAAEKICIYGGSFGGFSALMSAIREPELYQCAAGFAGVYDLELLYTEGDVRETSMGRRYLERVVGSDSVLREQSPMERISELKIPLFIAHGGRDQRAPIEHAEAVIDAVEKLDVPLKTHINKSGGHGFYSEKANEAYYRDLLDFLATYLR